MCDFRFYFFFSPFQFWHFDYLLLALLANTVWAVMYIFLIESLLVLPTNDNSEKCISCFLNSMACVWSWFTLIVATIHCLCVVTMLWDVVFHCGFQGYYGSLHQFKFLKFNSNLPADYALFVALKFTTEWLIRHKRSKVKPFVISFIFLSYSLNPSRYFLTKSTKNCAIKCESIEWFKWKSIKCIQCWQ